MRILFKLLFWTLLALPLALLTYDYVREADLVFGEIYYGDYVHLTGRIAAWLLLTAMLATPLRLTFPRSAAVRVYAGARRNIGVASFAYAAAHLTAYLLRQDWARIAEDYATPGFWTGWIAFAIFLALAVTSNGLAVRLLRRGWKSLHRLVHVAALLVFVHWALTAFDPMLAWYHIGALALLEGWRLFVAYRPRSFSAA